MGIEGATGWWSLTLGALSFEQLMTWCLVAECLVCLLSPGLAQVLECVPEDFLLRPRLSSCGLCPS